MTQAQRRGLNNAITRVWSFLAPAYDLPFLQQWVYRPPHDEVIAQAGADALEGATPPPTSGAAKKKPRKT